MHLPHLFIHVFMFIIWRLLLSTFFFPIQVCKYMKIYYFCVCLQIWCPLQSCHAHLSSFGIFWSCGSLVCSVASLLLLLVTSRFFRWTKWLIYCTRFWHRNMSGAMGICIAILILLYQCKLLECFSVILIENAFTSTCNNTIWSKYCANPLVSVTHFSDLLN